MRSLSLNVELVNGPAREPEGSRRSPPGARQGQEQRRNRTEPAIPSAQSKDARMDQADECLRHGQRSALAIKISLASPDESCAGATAGLESRKPSIAKPERDGCLRPHLRAVKDYRVPVRKYKRMKYKGHRVRRVRRQKSRCRRCAATAWAALNSQPVAHLVPQVRCPRSADPGHDAQGSGRVLYFQKLHRHQARLAPLRDASS